MAAELFGSADAVAYFPVVYINGDHDIEVGSVLVHPSLSFDTFQETISQMIGVARHRLSMTLVRSNNIRALGNQPHGGYRRGVRFIRNRLRAGLLHPRRPPVAPEEAGPIQEEESRSRTGGERGAEYYDPEAEPGGIRRPVHGGGRRDGAWYGGRAWAVGLRGSAPGPRAAAGEVPVIDSRGEAVLLPVRGIRSSAGAAPVVR
ncbi:unnamed protein product [Musa acuminata subsp. burmannicoides]